MANLTTIGLYEDRGTCSLALRYEDDGSGNTIYLSTAMFTDVNKLFSEVEYVLDFGNPDKVKFIYDVAVKSGIRDLDDDATITFSYYDSTGTLNEDVVAPLNEWLTAYESNQSSSDSVFPKVDLEDIDGSGILTIKVVTNYEISNINFILRRLVLK